MIQASWGRCTNLSTSKRQRAWRSLKVAWSKRTRERPILKIGCSISVIWMSLILMSIIYHHLSSFVIMYQNHLSYNIMILCHHHFRQIKVSMCLVKLQYITRSGDVNPQGDGGGGWGYVNVPWTCTHGWMLCNRCWRNGDNVSSICTTVCCHTPWMQTLTSEAGETWERGNGGTGAVLRAFYRTLVLIKPKALEIAVNKLSARVLQGFPSWLIILPCSLPRKCGMRFHSAKDMDDALSIGRFVEILLLDIS